MQPLAQHKAYPQDFTAEAYTTKPASPLTAINRFVAETVRSSHDADNVILDAIDNGYHGVIFTALIHILVTAQPLHLTSLSQDDILPHLHRHSIPALTERLRDAIKEHTYFGRPLSGAVSQITKLDQVIAPSKTQATHRPGPVLSEEAFLHIASSPLSVSRTKDIQVPDHLLEPLLERAAPEALYFLPLSDNNFPIEKILEKARQHNILFDQDSAHALLAKNPHQVAEILLTSDAPTRLSYIFFDTAQIPCGDDTLAEELAHSITPEDLLEESSWVFRITHHLPDSRQEIIAEHIPYYAAHTLLPRHRMGDYPIYPHARAHAIERVLTTKDERMTVHYLDERPEQTLSQLIETMNAVLAEEPTPASSDSR